MKTIFVSPEFPLNRRMRKAIRRGKLQVVRVPGERLSLGGGMAVEARRAVRTVSSPLVCMADGGAEVGGGLGGGNGEKESQGNQTEKKGKFPFRRPNIPMTAEEHLRRHMAAERMLRRPLGASLQPFESVFADTIATLDNDEDRFIKEGDEAVSKFEKYAEKFPVEAQEEYLWEEYEYLLERHEGIRPLLARYAVLTTVVSMVEWHAQLILKHEVEEMNMFLKLLSEEENRNDYGKELLRKAIGRIQESQQPGTSDALKELAKKAGIPTDSGGMQTHGNLVAVRNAIVHCGGNVNMTQNPDRCEHAAQFLGFKVADSIPLREGRTMKLYAKCILIGRGDLNPHIESMGSLLDKLRARPYL